MTPWSRYVKGDKDALGEIYDSYYHRLASFCAGWLRDLQLAENAASETFLKLLEHKNPGEIDDFESWIFAVARNNCNTNVTRTARRNQILCCK